MSWTAQSFAAAAPLPGPFGKTSPASSTGEHPLDVLLSWEKSEDAESFEVCIDTVSNSTCDTSWDDVGAVLSASPPGLLPETAYYWQVRAKNGAGVVEADSDTWWRFGTAATPVPVDFNKDQPVDTDTGISVGTEISWNKSEGATSYAWCHDVSNDNNCSGSWQDVGNNGSASLAGFLAPGTKYYWQARASNDNGETEADAGDWWDFTTSDVPNDFSKNVPAQSSFDVSPFTSLDWGISFATDSYEYCVDMIDNDGCDGVWVNVGTNSASAALSLDAETEYYWQVRAIHEGEITEADVGAWWRFKTQAEPGSFSKEEPANNSPNVSFKTQLSWSKSSNADEYEYCIDSVAGNQCDTVWRSISEGMTDPLALQPNTLYYWQVRAINSVGTTESNNGTWWLFTTVPLQVFEDSF